MIIMKKTLFAFYSFLLLLSFGCSSNDANMDGTIFIPDETNLSLPAYTEWGYNTFGAKYERSYFLVAKNVVPCKITYRNDSLNFVLIGHWGTDSFENYGQGPMRLAFSFPMPLINDYTGLATLDGKVIVLPDEPCVVTMVKGNSTETTLVPISGKLTFKRAQLLEVDDVVDRVILSGTFNLKYLVSGLQETFSEGRFDIAIGDPDFWYDK
ncbi:hypothetical protein FACS1894199_06610 [Bacteroidia bacterium]|nr:hypothetical protein FACS1894199_06610 [Bacteroidia bacterium]